MTELLGALYDAPPVPVSSMPHGTKRKCAEGRMRHHWDIDWSDANYPDGIDFCWKCDAAFSRLTGKRLQ